MLKTFFASIALLLLTWVLSSSCAWAQSASSQAAGVEAPIGKVVSATGTATIEHAVVVAVQANLSRGAIPAKVGDFVYRNDVVQTAGDGKLGITFTDGTTFNISSNARMVLDDFVYDPKGKSNLTSFSLTRGTFTFVAGQVAKTGNMRVETPVGTMGIRGTTPRVEIGADGSVKFSTLVEEKKAGVATPDVQSVRPRQRRSEVPLSREQAASYDKLFRVDHHLCRGC